MGIRVNNIYMDTREILNILEWVLEGYTPIAEEQLMKYSLRLDLSDDEMMLINALTELCEYVKIMMNKSFTDTKINLN